MATKPLILITNDDGYRAKGINELIRVAHDYGEIVVMAPESPRSGFSMAITCEHPVSYKLVREEDGVRIYGCSGTPTDCVKLALMELSPRRPALILSGINHGNNAGINAHYSGTMGAVFEGCLKRIPSVGFSLYDHRPDADFTPCFPYIKKVIEETLLHGLPESICLNVNFPFTADIKGIKVCTQDIGIWENEWYRTEIPPREKSVYWLTGSYRGLRPDDTRTDNWALEHGYASITPMQMDMTAYNQLDSLKERFK